MASDKTLLYYGALLHDVGKVIYRSTSQDCSHAQLGADFIAREVASGNEFFSGDDGRKIVEQVRYHHLEDLSAGQLSDDSLAYITCFANIVAVGNASDNEGDGRQTAPADRDAKLRRIFNTLNGHHDDAVIEHEAYDVIGAKLQKGLSGIGVSPEEVSDLLALLEMTTAAIPASVQADGLNDVSLYDHSKTVAGIVACVYEYLRERGVSDYRAALLGEGLDDDPKVVPMFLLYSCDMSGIQDFIYSISGTGALKQLRARSMYLELLLEHIVDELLDKLGLNRANLLYTGGGHAYLLLPNTAQAESVLRSFDEELGAWFVDHYRTDLYVASAWVPCCADDLANQGPDKKRYPMLYRRLSRGLSEAKAARYDAATIRKLNFGGIEDFDHSRECSECHRSDLHLDKDNKCTLCSSLGIISKSLIDKDVFVVDRGEVLDDTHAWRTGLALPFGYQLRMYAHEGFDQQRSVAHRIYTKNDVTLPGCSATHIWMGDYTVETGDEGISVYAKQGISLEPGKGIGRLGVLRADVDDLGATFVSGLPERRVSISRSSTLSRALSYFFKYKINEVLRQGAYQAQIIYSGGDDLFIVGNWSDMIYAACDIRRALDDYTQNGTLTISGGIGMFGPTYPIARMADETGELEDAAKDYESKDGTKKNAIALWSPDSVFGWDEFINVVMPRVQEVRNMFEHNEKGNSFIYRLIDLLRNFDTVAAAPRLAYLLARSFENDQAHGSEACRQIYAWAQDERERRCLVAAMEWYVCSVREGNQV